RAGSAAVQSLPVRAWLLRATPSSRGSAHGDDLIEAGRGRSSKERATPRGRLFRTLRRKVRRSLFAAARPQLSGHASSRSHDLALRPAKRLPAWRADQPSAVPATDPSPAFSGTRARRARGVWNST